MPSGFCPFPPFPPSPRLFSVNLNPLMITPPPSARLPPAPLILSFFPLCFPPKAFYFIRCFSSGFAFVPFPFLPSSVCRSWTDSLLLKKFLMLSVHRSSVPWVFGRRCFLPPYPDLLLPGFIRSTLSFLQILFLTVPLV